MVNKLETNIHVALLSLFADIGLIHCQFLLKHVVCSLNILIQTMASLVSLLILKPKCLQLVLRVFYLNHLLFDYEEVC